MKWNLVKSLLIIYILLQNIIFAQSYNTTLLSYIDTGNQSVWDVAVETEYAYLATQFNLKIYNVIDPNLPIHISDTYIPGHAIGIAKQGNYAYILTDNDLTVVNVTNVDTPMIVSNLSLSGYPYDIEISGVTAFIATTGGLDIINILNPLNPIFLGHFTNTGDWNKGVSVRGTFAYLACSTSGLKILNISNPSNPTQVSSLDTYDAESVFTVGNNCFIADGDSGLKIIDVNDKINPYLISSFYTSGYAGDLLIDGVYCYIAAEHNGLRIIEISNLLLPEEVGFFYVPNYARRVNFKGNISFVSCISGSEGLYLIRNDLLTNINLVDNITNGFTLYNNYPNPFNPVTLIRYSVPIRSFVTIKVYDLLGNEIKTLVNEEKVFGNYEVKFDGGNFSSGVYFYKMQANDFVDIKKLVLIK